MSRKLEPNGVIKCDGEHLLQIAMPMGGIGAGTMCFNGIGGVQDFSIHNKPAMSALPDGHGITGAAFALLHIKGDKPTTRLVEGPMPPQRIYAQGLKAQGYREGGFEGLPRFNTCTFTGEYPFGHVDLTHPAMPLAVKVTGFSPFIPLDDRNSSMPCAIVEYQLTNTTSAAVEYELSYHLTHMAPSGKGRSGDRNAAIDGFGVSLTNTEHPNAEAFGSMAMGIVGHEPRIKAMWARGGWFDWINALWQEVSTGTFTANAGNADSELTGHNGGSILMEGKLAPGESITYPIVITWHFPNSNLAMGQPPCDCDEGCGCAKEDADPAPPQWRPYYAGQWKDAAAVALYVRDEYEPLRARTRAFRDALASSTLPAEAIDAVGSNLAIIKSPTVLRQENGNLWAWEGCFCDHGCCSGSCTHVWNYAQAVPHLFPALERTFREQELERSMDEQGHVTFRSALPDGPTGHSYHPAADGQLGGIMKVYRDWQISGDQQWLKKMFPLAKRSMDFCIGKWDPDRLGALLEPHHNTYDIEFWGPDGMCTTIYLGALSAMAAMCEAMGHTDDAAKYRELAARGAKYMDEHLFNGEYYNQRVMWDELKDQSFTERMAAVNDDSPEVDRIQKAEGPKYQYGNGCISDGVIGAWMARIYGIDTPTTNAKVKQTLAAIHKHNFKNDLSDHACTQRPGYAMGHEAGLILCTWPHGDRPILPFVYSDEVWTGIEYQVASHLIAEGMTDAGMDIVRGARSRYDGLARNPFNEYECGSYYARALASYALLGALGGFRYSAVDKRMWLSPRTADRPFRLFISTAGGWGVLTLSQTQLTIELNEGELAIDELVLGEGEAARTFTVNATAQAGAALAIDIA